MKKIAVIGSGGSGKSTFSKELAQKLGLPLYHLDAYFWRTNWTPTPAAEWDIMVKDLSCKNEWIIDGNYSRTLDFRLERADTIIYFNFSRLITTYRVIKRRIMYHGKTRPDLNKDCPEQLDWAFIKWVWNFNRDKHPQIMQKLQALNNKKVIVFKNPKQVQVFLKQL